MQGVDTYSFRTFDTTTVSGGDVGVNGKIQSWDERVFDSLCKGGLSDL